MRGSKYCPVNWNDVEKKLESLEGTVAVVALPCQINALKSYFRNRKSSIKYYISLLCNHTPSIFASNFLAYYRSGNSRFSITYRGSGWPGYTTIVAKRGRKKISWRLKFRKMWRTGFGKYFKTKRCIICNDPFAKNADVVMGDSYFLQDRDAIGSTFCIVRSIEIWNILKEMHHEGIINIKNGPEIHQINESYKSLFNREQIFEKRNMILKKMRHAYVKTSSGSGKDIKVSIKDILRFKKTLFVSQLGRYKWLWKILAEKNNMASEIENL